MSTPTYLPPPDQRRPDQPPTPPDAWIPPQGPPPVHEQFPPPAPPAGAYGSYTPPQSPPPAFEQYAPTTRRRNRKPLFLVLLVVGLLAITGTVLGITLGGGSSSSTMTPLQQQQQWDNAGGVTTVNNSIDAANALKNGYPCSDPSLITQARSSAQAVLALPDAAPTVEPSVNAIAQNELAFAQDAVNYCAAPSGSAAESAALVSAQIHFTALSNASDAEAAARDAVLGASGGTSGASNGGGAA